MSKKTKKPAAGRTDRILEVLMSSRKPKTCREIMAQAGMETDEFKFAASILVGLANRNIVEKFEGRECSVTGRVSMVYAINWEEIKKTSAA